MYFDDETPFLHARSLCQLNCEVCAAEGQPQSGKCAAPHAAPTLVSAPCGDAALNLPRRTAAGSRPHARASALSRRGPGGAFSNLSQLREHLKNAHKKHMCTVCLEGRKALVSQQLLYSQVRWPEPPLSVYRLPPLRPGAPAAVVRSERMSPQRSSESLLSSRFPLKADAAQLAARCALSLRPTSRGISAAARQMSRTSSAPQASRREQETRRSAVVASL